MGPILFLIFINDLPAYLKHISSVLFADDTTLCFSHDNLDSVISLCRAGARALVKWCECNRLEVNWSKTHIMFIWPKRIILPNTVALDSSTISVVKEFKLLGIWLDDKLSFKLHVSKTCMLINRKLYSIKNIFYLSNDVKLQFFKTFILPYFDYSISLLVYFSKESVRKLAKLYHKINLSRFSTPYEMNSALKPFHLFSFQHRCVFRILSFIFKLKINKI